METIWKTALQHQFDAAIGMLENALNTCPDRLWKARLWDDPTAQPGLSEFWYVAYHTLFWLDLYLSGSVEGFTPPPPYTLDELDPAGLLPERVYSRAELLAYLEHCRGKLQAILAGLTDEQACRLCKVSWGQPRYAELLLDNMRHVQEHAAQLNMALGQQAGLPGRWVSQVKGAR